ncbi:hypothetical protein SAY87_020968 [Trapa incisa]|uniref:non-specific serine/threonine protein kinase n=1 Tax=Trapa incisa TaxID=236973 RepID=A0AAN7JRP1_9MYRT|nr:hypothetical protein SAY87_020968 [Trapa incisa]
MELHHPRKKLAFMAPIVFFLAMLSVCSALFDNTTFNYSSFDPNSHDFAFEGNVILSNSFIQLTTTTLDEAWATYSRPMHLWDGRTGKTADFTTRFSFSINSNSVKPFGDGLTFFLVPNGTGMPLNSNGGFFGLCSSTDSSPILGDCNGTFDFVAVEFDTFSNEWDPDGPHVGIDINTVISAVTVPWTWNKIVDGGTAQAWISYDSSAKNLSVILGDEHNTSSLYYRVNLSSVLPEWVNFGFSATTGTTLEIHKILSWEFNSSLEIADPSIPLPTPPAPTPSPPLSTSPWRIQKNLWAWLYIIACASVLVLIAVVACLCMRSKKEVSGFENNHGPREFSYRELATATGYFDSNRLIGLGGSGKFYEGYLPGMGSKVAIKKITCDSEYQMQQYAEEVMLVCQLKHRNLVKLIGWCQKEREFFIVYEFMSNGSLDFHLFEQQRTLLTWESRYRVALDMASVIQYLHENLREDWGQCVIHRDIKCSNILLDSDFSAKLGDFVLPRHYFIHGEDPQTSKAAAGTTGYIAPGKASKESDVYSFGIVALELACGRRVVENGVPIVSFVWELYGAGKLLDAVDPRLKDNFDLDELERLMMVGLWCAHPDYTLRPSIQLAFLMLEFKAPLPALPSMMPDPIKDPMFPSSSSEYKLTILYIFSLCLIMANYVNHFQFETNEIICWEFSSSLDTPPPTTGGKSHKNLWLWIIIPCTTASVVMITVVVWIRSSPKEAVERTDSAKDGTHMLPL